jgi:hypothetical protein
MRSSIVTVKMNMADKKRIRRTKDIDRMIAGLEDVALAGAGAMAATGVGAGLIGALRA